MTIETLGPDEYYYQRALVNDAYIIFFHLTVLGQTRVGFSYKDDWFSTEASWCCGFSVPTMMHAVNCMLGYIEKNSIKKMPGMSDIKPLHKDLKFLERIEPYNTNYFTLETFQETFFPRLKVVPIERNQQ